MFDLIPLANLYFQKHTMSIDLTTMNKKTIVGFLCALALMACGQKNNAKTAALAIDRQKNDFVAQLAPLVQRYVELGTFSGVVLVSESDETLFHKAFGLADRSTGKPNELNTLFDIGMYEQDLYPGSCQTTCRRGTVEVIGTSGGLCSRFQGRSGQYRITIEHLLEHRSGFGDYHGQGYFDLPLEQRSLNAIVERSKEDTLLFPPGESDRYSNLGYVLLGKIIEVATGKSYFTNVQERIVDKLELENTYLQHFEGLEGRIAKGYYYTPLGALEENSPFQDRPNPDGGFLFTTDDIKKFYHSYFYDTLLLSAKSKEADPYFQFLSELPEGRAAVAAGGFEGFNSVILQVIGKDLSVIVFANMDEPVAERIATDILALYRGESPDKPSLPAIQNVRINFEQHGVDFIKNNFDSLTVNFLPLRS